MNRTKELLALLGILASGLFLRISHAMSSGLWRDEAQALDIAMLPSVRAMTDFLIQHESHPPLYYLLLRGWTRLVGSTDTVLIVPGVALGLVTITLAWWIGRKVGGSASGLLAAALIALSYAVIEADSTVRPYSLVQPLLLASVALLWKAVTDGSPRALTGWCATAIALLYLHNWTVLPLAAMGTVALWLTATGRAATSLKHLFLAGLAVVLAWSPWLPELLHQIRHGGHLSPSSNPLIRMGAQFTFVVPGFYDGHGLVAWVSAASVLFLRRSSAPLEPSVRLGFTILGGTVLAAMLLAGLGSFLTNLLIVHTVAMLAPLALVAIACVLARPVREGLLLARVATFLVLATSVTDALRIAATPRTNADLIADYVSQQSGPEDLVLVVPVYVASSVHRYYRGSAPLAGFPDGAVTSPLEFNDRIARDTTSEVLRRVQDLIRRTLDRGGRVWQISFDAPEHLYRHWTSLEGELRQRTGSPLEILVSRREASLEHLDLRLWEIRSPMQRPGQ